MEGPGTPFAVHLCPYFIFSEDSHLYFVRAKRVARFGFAHPFGVRRDLYDETGSQAGRLEGEFLREVGENPVQLEPPDYILREEVMDALSPVLPEKRYAVLCRFEGMALYGKPL